MFAGNVSRSAQDGTGNISKRHRSEDAKPRVGSVGGKGQKSVGGLCHLLVQGGVRRRGEHAELLCPPLRVTVRLAGMHASAMGAQARSQR